MTPVEPEGTNEDGLPEDDLPKDEKSQPKIEDSQLTETASAPDNQPTLTPMTRDQIISEQQLLIDAQNRFIEEQRLLGPGDGSGAADDNPDSVDPEENEGPEKPADNVPNSPSGNSADTLTPSSPTVPAMTACDSQNDGQEVLTAQGQVMRCSDGRWRQAASSAPGEWIDPVTGSTWTYQTHRCSGATRSLPDSLELKEAFENGLYVHFQNLGASEYGPVTDLLYDGPIDQWVGWVLPLGPMGVRERKLENARADMNFGFYCVENENLSERSSYKAQSLKFQMHSNDQCSRQQIKFTIQLEVGHNSFGTECIKSLQGSQVPFQDIRSIVIGPTCIASFTTFQSEAQMCEFFEEKYRTELTGRQKAMLDLAPFQ